VVKELTPRYHDDLK